MSPPPSLSEPLQGGCLCGGVRFELTGPLLSGGYCHCTHCQRRTGGGFAVTGRVARESFRLLRGEELLRSYQPAGGRPKVFCEVCGSALFSGEPLADEQVAVRYGVLEADPGLRPQSHQYVDSAAAWDVIPEDGLPRYPAARPS